MDASTAAGLSCKLTGAGGGGCAITLLPSSSSHNGRAAGTVTASGPALAAVSGSGGVASSLSEDMTPHSDAQGSSSEELEVALKVLGFDTFESSLAGDGVRWI